ncbi:MAG: hypothetical protein ACR2OC_04305 [Solirubrobacterales bacterium]
MTRFRKLFLLSLLVLVAPVVLVACGGDDTADIDPEQVLTETFSNDEQVTSGTISLSLGGSVEGEQSGSGEVSLSGAFQGDAENPTALPQLDLTGSVSGESNGISIDQSGELTITEDNAYVSYQDTAYELGTEIFGQFQTLVETAAAQAGGGATGAEGSTTETASFTEQCTTLLEQAGGNTAACDTVDVFSWFNLTNEGEEEIEGSPTIHIHGTVDIPAIIENINATIAAAEITGATEIPEESAQQVEDAISDLSFDVYSGVDDRLLRGFDLNVTVDASAIPDNDGSVTSITGNLETRVGSPNEPQTIEAPADAQPLDDLLGQFGLSAADIEAALSGYSTQFGLSGLGTTGLGGSTDLGTDTGTDLGSSGGGLGGGGGGGDDVEAASAFFDCIADAKTPDELKACNKLAP